MDVSYLGVRISQDHVLSRTVQLERGLHNDVQVAERSVVLVQRNTH